MSSCFSNNCLCSSFTSCSFYFLCECHSASFFLPAGCVQLCPAPTCVLLFNLFLVCLYITLVLTLPVVSCWLGSSVPVLVWVFWTPHHKTMTLFFFFTLLCALNYIDIDIYYIYIYIYYIDIASSLQILLSKFAFTRVLLAKWTRRLSWIFHSSALVSNFQDHCSN